jgi:hypothetical protein
MATSIANLALLSKVWLADISILIRGNHGIGKSEVVYQLAKELKLPVMERRLSQMSEGDMIGLPWQEVLSAAVTDTERHVVEGVQALVALGGRVALDSNFKVTSFAPPDWLAQCANEPHLIFLDEFNRATPEVMQAAFQLVLDRRIGSLKIHPECRIYAAINVAASYQVNEMDPALLDRFAVVDLEPTVEDWLTWAKGIGNINQLMIDFINQHPSHLEISAKDKVTPGTITPSRRSWARLDKCLQGSDLYSDDGVRQPVFFQVCASLVGVAAAGPFQKFCQDNNSVTAEDILNKWNKVKGRIEQMSANNRVPELTGVIDRLSTFFANNKLTQAQAENYERFAKTIPTEMVVSSWIAIAKSGGLDNCGMIQQGLSQYIVAVVQKGRSAGKTAA